LSVQKGRELDIKHKQGCPEAELAAAYLMKKRVVLETIFDIC